MIDNSIACDILQVFNRQKEKAKQVRKTTVRDRKRKLKTLERVILEHREELYNALWKDLRKPATEVDISEIYPTLSELRFAGRKLGNWMRDHKVKTPFTFPGGKSWIRYESKGTCLIISPWNYPFQLSMAPLISAIAAGNTAIIKPSEYAENTSRIIKKIVEKCFPVEEVTVIEGAVDVSSHLLQQGFNHIFFTGSPEVGKIVMEAAAKRLTSITLELGGKSPVVVDESADIDISATRIAWAKYTNAGQTCIAPDYVLVHESRKVDFLKKLQDKIEAGYGKRPSESPDYVRIINDKHFERIKAHVYSSLEQGGNIVYGGEFLSEDLYIQPTIITDLPLDSDLMKFEIFGPVLPVISYKTREEAIGIISDRQPLALYIYSRNKQNTDYYLSNTISGSVCINTSSIHVGNPHLPFGGINNSGIGKSRGFYGFKEFSNERGVFQQKGKSSVIEWIRPPYTSQKRKILNWLIKYF